MIQLQSFNSMLGSLGTDKMDKSVSMGGVCVSVCSIQTPGLLFPHRVTVLATQLDQEVIHVPCAYYFCLFEGGFFVGLSNKRAEES